MTRLKILPRFSCNDYLDIQSVRTMIIIRVLVLVGLYLTAINIKQDGLVNTVEDSNSMNCPALKNELVMDASDVHHKFTL